MQSIRPDVTLFHVLRYIFFSSKYLLWSKNAQGSQTTAVRSQRCYLCGEVAVCMYCGRPYTCLTWSVMTVSSCFNISVCYCNLSTCCVVCYTCSLCSLYNVLPHSNSLPGRVGRHWPLESPLHYYKSFNCALRDISTCITNNCLSHTCMHGRHTGYSCLTLMPLVRLALIHFSYL